MNRRTFFAALAAIAAAPALLERFPHATCPLCKKVWTDQWVVEHMADMAIALATNPRAQAAELKWSGMFVAGRSPG